MYKINIDNFIQNNFDTPAQKDIYNLIGEIDIGDSFLCYSDITDQYYSIQQLSDQFFEIRLVDKKFIYTAKSL